MNKPIRILQVFTIMNRGGAETMIMNYYRNIDRSKVQFDFLVHRKERGAYDDEIESMGGKIYRLDPINYLKLKSYKNKLDHFFKKNDYKIVHSHLNAISKYVLKIAKENNIPVRIAHSHIALVYPSLKKIINKENKPGDVLKAIYKNIAKKNIVKYANHLFACEEKAGIWLYGKENFSKVKIINNAIDSSLFIYNPDLSIQLKEKFNLNSKLVFGHIGRFNQQKNHLFLLDIFDEIVKLNKNSLLFLIGDGELKEIIERKIKSLSLTNNVFLLGLRKDISDLLQVIDIFLMPSLYEGLPVTLIEAQAAGLKCFVSDAVDKKVDITGLIDFISLKKNAKQWAEQILKNKDYSRTNTYDKIVANGYDIKGNAKWLENFYLSIL